MTRNLLVLLSLLSVAALAAGPRVSLVQGYSFDPLVEQPNLPAALTVDSYAGDYGYYIVQFTGPVLPEWRAAAERAGAQLLEYLPQYAFVCRIPNRDLDAVRSLSAVRWVGLFQPAYKLFPRLETWSGTQRLIVVFFRDEEPWRLTDDLAALGATGILPEFNEWNSSVRIDVDAAAIPAIAAIPGVSWIEPYGEITPDNQNVQWVDQHGYSPSDTTRTIWAKGVTGSSVFVGLTDEQLWMNHNLFRDTVNNTPGPTHRKVIRYFGTQGAGSHGTHTSGTLCGNDAPVGGTSFNDGMAKDARLIFQWYSAFPTGWDMNTWFSRPDSGVSGMRALNHSMSLSRKDTFNTYIFSDMTADQFVWNHRQFLHCNSMGNYGINRMGHPVIAKNIISTGGTQNGTLCRNIYTSTSRGPTLDGRRKPQLVSPAEDVYSASSSSPTGYVTMSGTSMATPNMTGSMALIRDYFRKGFYPTGDTLTGTPMEISAALNKATGIVGADNDVSGYTVPDNNVGWGRVDLDSSLYFAGDSSRLWVTDETLGLQTGDSLMYDIEVTSSSRPFRVALCWTDYPGTMRAALILVNDLNLTVVAPNGDTFKGNVYSSGQSATGGIYDTLNVEECIRRNSPALGTWKVRVKARNVPQGPQPFALAAIGTFETQAPPQHDVGVAAILSPADTVDSGAVVTPLAVVRNYGTTLESLAVFMQITPSYYDSKTLTLAAGEFDTVDFDTWVALPLGGHAVRCSTYFAGDENPANDAVSDSFMVVPGTGVAESPDLPRIFTLEQARPNPFTRTTVLRYGVPQRAAVELAVYSIAGTKVRTLASGEREAGWHSGRWDGRDNSGRLASRGVYYCRLVSNGAVQAEKLIKLE